MAVRGVIAAAPNGDEDVCIVDLEASTEHLLVATAKHADAMYESLSLTARRWRLGSALLPSRAAWAWRMSG